MKGCLFKEEKSPRLSQMDGMANPRCGTQGKGAERDILLKWKEVKRWLDFLYLFIFIKGEYTYVCIYKGRKKEQNHYRLSHNSTGFGSVLYIN